MSETAGTPLGPYRVIKLPRSAIGALELRSSERRSAQDAMGLMTTLFRRTNHGNLREFRKSPHKHDTSHTVTTRETRELLDGFGHPPSTNGRARKSTETRRRRISQRSSTASKRERHTRSKHHGSSPGPRCGQIIADTHGSKRRVDEVRRAASQYRSRITLGSLAHR